MVKKISLLGMELDNYSFPEAIKIIESFLSDTVLSTVLSVDLKKLLRAGEDPAVREVLCATAYTVITDRTLLEVSPDSGAERMFEVADGSFARAFLNHMYRADRTFYLVAGSRADLIVLRRYLTENFSYIRILGESVIMGSPTENERHVNSINILMPDVILSVLDSPQEERFLKQYQPQLCARVWYGAGRELLQHKSRFSIGERIRQARDRSFLRARLRNR